jgi:putative two-component system response regulator
MPEMSGLEAIKILKNAAIWREIPVIFLTSVTGLNSELDGLSYGAVDYITKPFDERLLRKRVEIQLLILNQRQRLETQSLELRNYNDNLRQMVEEETDKDIKLQDSVLDTVVDLVESRDDITGGHVSRTMRWLEIITNGLLESGEYASTLSAWDIKLFIRSSRLHDVGKISIDDAILKKPAKLTNAEFDSMKAHTLIGASVIEKITLSLPQSNDHFLNHAKILALSHHEKWNGSGYPSGLSGYDIPLQGRLMAISDVFDALISKRPYKNAFSFKDASDIIIAGSGSHFDPILIEIFKKTLSKFAAFL